MQEEVENRTLTLVVSGTKFTGRLFKAQQQAAAKEEIGKPFPFEDDLRVKSARLVELDTLLNIDGKGHAQPETVVAKSARPSVLDSLKRPVPPRSPEKKPKQHEEVR